MLKAAVRMADANSDKDKKHEADDRLNSMLAVIIALVVGGLMLAQKHFGRKRIG